MQTASPLCGTDEHVKWQSHFEWGIMLIGLISLKLPLNDIVLNYLKGPAGTGKTESVKALGHQLGRFVLVFNCDETFDFQVS